MATHPSWPCSAVPSTSVHYKRLFDAPTPCKVKSKDISKVRDDQILFLTHLSNPVQTIYCPSRAQVMRAPRVPTGPLPSRMGVSDWRGL